MQVNKKLKLTVPEIAFNLRLSGLSIVSVLARFRKARMASRVIGKLLDMIIERANPSKRTVLIIRILFAIFLLLTMTFWYSFWLFTSLFDKELQSALPVISAVYKWGASFLLSITLLWVIFKLRRAIFIFILLISIIFPPVIRIMYPVVGEVVPSLLISSQSETCQRLGEHLCQLARNGNVYGENTGSIVIAYLLKMTDPNSAVKDIDNYIKSMRADSSQPLYIQRIIFDQYLVMARYS